MGGDLTVYTLLSTCLVVNHYIPIVYHLFPYYLPYLYLVLIALSLSCLFLDLDPINASLLCLCVFSVQSELQKPSDMFLCTKVFSLWIKQVYIRILSNKLVSFTMPGHDHSIVPKLKPGDLGTWDAFLLWNCPIQDEGLSIRQHVIE